ncbi:MAG: HU family DNA-binding protein [Geminicoccaceae bacterium]|nr:HU family DNA-binding protein [Geminicoccaceae bacterium]MCS7266947.1 HU family DNA-binding protein [Geminicoccaceae bacterium]MCX7629691.1 HU family DNA-binding protein [Geminicoccaceae bacterium]MDW8123431.1 HU family DNA-binding protein [Geminicoccaceae bacterium]MDW8341755.1 HU family DNA-binding protein [Geminicoccaceae bacterium]
MTLEELSAAVAQSTGMTKAKAAEAIHAVLGGIQEALKRGNRVAIAGFGVFEVTHRAAREGRNPQTGERIQIKASKSVRFRPGKNLRDAVNS